ncbi:hypothetical protein A7U60_g3202 [Sanghuangporus baumii]|uniref:Uncharacterized protein n=1 Tax=Sanghuangporus baumii TaxID=108892 RepID=A0A9Q5I0X4_SANBA|nr:hypothetical protein A7U60_g3202 [Sanghuangporus baumii]
MTLPSGVVPPSANVGFSLQSASDSKTPSRPNTLDSLRIIPDTGETRASAATPRSVLLVLMIMSTSRHDLSSRKLYSSSSRTIGSKGQKSNELFAKRRKRT